MRKFLTKFGLFVVVTAAILAAAAYYIQWQLVRYGVQQQEQLDVVIQQYQVLLSRLDSYKQALKNLEKQQFVLGAQVNKNMLFAVDDSQQQHLVLLSVRNMLYLLQFYMLAHNYPAAQDVLIRLSKMQVDTKLLHKLASIRLALSDDRYTSLAQLSEKLDYWTNLMSASNSMKPDSHKIELADVGRYNNLYVDRLMSFLQGLVLITHKESAHIAADRELKQLLFGSLLGLQAAVLAQDQHAYNLYIRKLQLKLHDRLNKDYAELTLFVDSVAGYKFPDKQIDISSLLQHIKQLVNSKI